MLKKKGILSMMMLFAGIASLFAQEGNPQGERGQKAREMKVAFLTEELQLTEVEADSFWPLYDSYTQKKKEYRKNIKSIKQSINENKTMTDAEFTKVTNNISDLKIKEINNNREYINQCVTILGAQKTIQLIDAEKNFRKKIHEKRQSKR